MQSMLLDRTQWDLVLDASRSIAICNEPYAVLQDVACAIRTFAGECWYDISQGIPYFTLVLGRNQSVAAFRAQAEAAALTVPDVGSAQCVITGIGADRKLRGAIQVSITSTGNTLLVGF